MYSVVEIKGHQYRVQPGDLLDVEKIEAEVGSSVDFDSVLFVGGDKPQVGAPTVSGAKVTAQIVRQARTRKIIVLKRSPGKYRKKNGHRQNYTGLLITEVSDGSGNSVKIDKESKQAKRFLK